MDKQPCLKKALSLGEWISVLRKRHGMSQRQLAEQAGLSASKVCRIEADQDEPSFSEAQRLAHILEVAITELIAEPEGEHWG